jgi:hypothetical protein
MKYCNGFKYTGYFSNPALPSKTKSGLPPILEENTEFKESIQQFCTSNLQTLMSESAHDYICNVAVPILVESIQKIYEDDKLDMPDKLFEMYNLRSISLTTVTNWMHRLSFKY